MYISYVHTNIPFLQLQVLYLNIALGLNIIKIHKFLLHILTVFQYHILFHVNIYLWMTSLINSFIISSRVKNFRSCLELHEAIITKNPGIQVV